MQLHPPRQMTIWYLAVGAQGIVNATFQLSICLRIPSSMDLKSTTKAVSAVLQTNRGGSPAKVIVLSGAGASVASGIPDFRSPGGMYDTLKPDLLTASVHDRAIMAVDATHVLSRDLFTRNSLPYHEVRRPFIIGSAEKRWKPTLAHMFCRLLHDNGHLKRVYSQNIDGLDFDVGLPEEKIVCMHGSIRQCVCEACYCDPYDGDFATYVRDVRGHIRDIYGIDRSAPAVSSPIVCRKCGSPSVKPSTTLFGSSLPAAFYESILDDFHEHSDVALLFATGSSLTVYPAATLPDKVPEKCHRVLVNREHAGSFDFEKRDFWMKGNCDDVLLSLISELGWLRQLEHLSEHLCTASKQLVRNLLEMT